MKALQTIQQKLKAPKSQYNSFGEYSYRNQVDILEAVKPLLAETNSELTLSDKLIGIGDSIFVEATATLTATNEHGNSESQSSTAYAKHAREIKKMQDAQITGSTSSYARKYALNGLFLIDDTRDSDSTNDHGESKPKAKPVAKAEPVKKDWLTPTLASWAYVVKRMKEGVSLEIIKQSFNISTSDEKKLLDEIKTK